MDATHFKPVDPRYRTLLRVEILLNASLVVILAASGRFLFPENSRLIDAGIVGLVLITALLATIWVERRYRFTAYSVLPKEVHFRAGALWLKITSVAVNRIQHVEISQGPLERGFGLACLIIFTAGGRGSDLTVPGLERAHAESIRDELLGRIAASEEVDGG